LVVMINGLSNLDDLYLKKIENAKNKKIGNSFGSIVKV